MPMRTVAVWTGCPACRSISEELLAAPVLDASLVSSAVETLGDLLSPYDLRVGTPPRVGISIPRRFARV